MKKSELKFLKRSMMYVPNGGIVVEIGSWMGGSSEQLAQGIQKYCHNVELHCIDPFDDEYFKNTKGLQKKIKKTGVKNIYEYFTKRMEPYSWEEGECIYQLHRKTSKECFHNDWDEDNLIDFVFIDGNHDYDYVKTDIDMWSRVLRDGGIICGHDYGKWGVKKAVDESFKNVRFPAESIWMVVK